jgi:prepilin-type N-terminal cleavage/methylation domain-containing protein
MKRRGFTLLEMLLVLAILGITFGIGAIGSRSILLRQENTAALRSVKQLFWHGATVAASRSINLELVRTNNVFVIRPVGGGTPFRTATLPNDVSSNLPQGVIARFTPPGKVAITALNANPFTLRLNDGTYQLTVSQIGEVREVKQ